MYTIDCKDPNCVECIQASEGQCPEKENQNKILMTVEELVSKKLLLACQKKELWASTCRRIKDEIHFRISGLIDVLRERERCLCTQVEQEYCNQVIQLDKDAASQCIRKLLKRNHEPETAVLGSKLVFNCEFNYILFELRKFGKLSWEYPSELKKKFCAKEYQKIIQLKEYTGKPFDNAALSTVPLDSPFEATSITEMENRRRGMIETLFKDDLLDFSLKSTDSVSSKEVGKDSSLNREREMVEKLKEDLLDFSLKGTDSVPSKEVGNRSPLFQTQLEKLKNSLENLRNSLNDEGQHFEDGADSVSTRIEVGKDSSSDEDDMEIISKSEAATIPSEMPPLPSKNRFRFGRKRSCFPSLYLKKPLLSLENNLAYDVPIYSETKSQKARMPLGLPEVEKLPSYNEQAGQESSSKCLAKPESSVVHDSKDVKRTDFMLSVAERKEIASFNEQSSQESSSQCLEDSNAEGQGHDPSVALLSSFKKYLEKNAEDEWLVPGKSSEQSLSSGNSCIFNRPNPFLVENLDQWLSTKNKQKVVSDWLYTAAV